MYLSIGFYNLNVNSIMFIKLEYITKVYERKSKTGILHQYTRKKTIITLMCDCCTIIFQRERGKMDPKRINNNFYHVCNSCDSKKFAQEKGIEKKHIWDLPVSCMKTIDQL